MISKFIFWLIVVPSSFAFMFGFVANIAQTMANKITDDPENTTLE